MRVGWLVGLTNDPYENIRYAVEEIGVHSGQLSVWDMTLYTRENADKLLTACKDFNFEITAVWCGWSGPHIWGYPGMYATIGLVPSDWRALRIQEILKGAEFARMLGVKNIITHAGYMPDNPFHPDRIGVMQSIKYICQQIAPYGQNFLFETGEMIPNTLIQLMVDVGQSNIGVNFDCANMIINARGNSADALTMLAPWIKGVHAKDATFPEGTNPKGKEVPLGEGKANFPVLLRILKENGYQGDLTIEREIEDKVQRDIDVRNGKVFLEKILAEME